MRLSSLFNGRRVQRAIAGAIESFRRNRLDDKLDHVLAALGPLPIHGGDQTVIADGMWRNPNHFFRLRLFLDALGGRYQLLGVLRRKSDRREKRALNRIGFEEFVYLHDDEEFRPEDFIGDADRLLASAPTHAELLALRLPQGIPAYTWYDTVLKVAVHPQPPLSHPQWRRSLAETLCCAAIYERELGRRSVAHVALSHPWKSEWASLVWLALKRSIPTYYLTGFCESFRLRRFQQLSDYANPVEHLSWASFQRLPCEIQAELSKVGREALRLRAKGRSSDLNARYAFNPQKRISCRETARLMLSGQTERPVVVIYSHVWYDFPHAFAMGNFTDFLDWMRLTLGEIRLNEDFVWVLKPHPTEPWYGGFSLSDLATDLPAHVHLASVETDSQTAVNAADAIVTVHGTVGLEAAAQGVPVLLADRSYFSDWPICRTAESREHYRELLAGIAGLARPDEITSDRAAACFALALAEPPADMGALPMSCDSGGSHLYAEVLSRWVGGRGGIARETQRLHAFLQQTDIDSFAAFHLIEAARRRSNAAFAI
jgi:hypothetical protein